MNFLFSFVLVTRVVSALSGVDPLWLRYDKIIPNLSDYSHISSIAVHADASYCEDFHLAALTSAADELALGLTGLLGRPITSICICCKSPPTDAFTISVHNTKNNGEEGFTLTPFSITSDTPSGALYGMFEFLKQAQTHQPPLSSYHSSPAMKIRSWNFWDLLSGDVERGNSGYSLHWPYALFEDAAPPPKNLLWVAARCNASDPFQQWEGETFTESTVPTSSSIKNLGSPDSDNCLNTMGCHPMSVGSCSGDSSASFIFNSANNTIAVDNSHMSTAEGFCERGRGGCMYLDRNTGPYVNIYNCHTPIDAPVDWVNQQFTYNATSKAIQKVREDDFDECLTLGRSAPYPDGANNEDDPLSDPWSVNSSGKALWKTRFEEMIKLLKSSGINTVVLNDVNTCGFPGIQLFEAEKLATWTKNIAPILDRWAMSPQLALCFAAPTEISNVTADPLDDVAISWWTDYFDQLYTLHPRFTGIVVKADSEGMVGPVTFDRSEADGANMLAKILKNYDSRVFWRSFVYGNPPYEIGLEDLARQAFDTFHPLDGTFDENVVLQVKCGPMDFQVREPPNPMIGGMQKSSIMMEVDAAQQYLGHQIHVVNLAQSWKWYLEWDTMFGEDGGSLTVTDILTDEEKGGASLWGGGLACVSNIGNMNNYTAHVLAASNTYSCGRLGWDPTLQPEQIDREWASMTFNSAKAIVDTVVDILGRSWLVFEGYTSPMGIGFIVDQDNPFGCAPKTNHSDGGGKGPDGSICPASGDHGDHYWMNPCASFDFANYSEYGIGCDRTLEGPEKMINVYSTGVQRILNDPLLIPPELTLFFHNLAWTDEVVPYSGGGDKIPVSQRIGDRHRAALIELQGMADAWNKLEDEMENDERWSGVRDRFLQQINDAAVYSEQIVGYYESIAGYEF